ncbi:hypothetical protein Vadar_031669 [Vaccinium darrowii]|uniref:Uncharacterized protein n=1 Tax=Vaccinium darrowii TaxID=229202 RepID=A0ACB7Y3A5_9ERIC|nr:hypothetical protein Vadar_031669 [Vaccinium darrowii]
MSKGMFGYLDLEYFFTCRLTKKSDVYAFGVVLLEVLCGRPAVDTRLEEEQQSLALWAQQCIKEEKLEQLIDPSLRYQISPECLKTFIGVASKCLHKHSSERPTMAAVMVSLESTLFSLGRHKISSTEVDVNVNGDSNSNDILLEGTVASPSTPVQFNDNTQRQKGSKKNFFQKGIAFLARGMDIWSLETCTEFSSLFPLTWGMLDEKVTSKNGKGFIVAVKRLDFHAYHRFQYWQSAVGFLGSHSNLVKLLGHCKEHEELLLVYEYMPKGSLASHLFGRLLDVKSVVYSFGVVLLEMLSGLRADNLVDRVEHLVDTRSLTSVMDSRLEGKYPLEAALQIAHLAKQCLGAYPKTRPSMKEVVETLESVSQGHTEELTEQHLEESGSPLAQPNCLNISEAKNKYNRLGICIL